MEIEGWRGKERKGNQRNISGLEKTDEERRENERIEKTVGERQRRRRKGRKREQEERVNKETVISMFEKTERMEGKKRR